MAILAMRQLAGQAALATGRWLHSLLTLVMAVILIATTAGGVLAWRLSQRPLDITWLVRRIEAASAPPGDGVRVIIGRAALAWEGWRLGLDHPLDIRLTDVSAARAGQPPIAEIPAAEVSLSFGWLLRGRIVPRAIGVEGALLRILRAPDGTAFLELGGADTPSRDTLTTDTAVANPAPGDTNPFNTLLTQFGAPPGADAAAAAPGAIRWSQLVHVHVGKARVVVLDRQLGATWRGRDADLDLRRRPGGGVDGTGDVTLTLGDSSAHIAMTAVLPPGGGNASVQARFSRLAPAALARAAPALAPLEAIDAPVDGQASLTLGPALGMHHATLQARMGAGTVLVAGSAIPVSGATLALDVDAGNDTGSGIATLRRLHLALVAPDGSRPGPVIDITGTARRDPAGAIAATLALDIDQVPFADLARYWPRNAAADARDWLTTNITAGTARAAHVELGLAIPPGGEPAVTAATGQLAGDDVSVAWLRPVPPIEHVQATLALLSPDELLITASGGRQAGTQLLVQHGTMRVTGLSAAHQLGAIDLALAGPVPDALAVLRQPRLHLLAKHPIDLANPAGQLTGRLALSLPLDQNVTIDQVAIHGQGQLTGLHLGHVAAGRDLDDAALDFDVTGDGLRMGGRATLAGIAATLGVQMDFRDGPPSQAVQKVTVAGSATTRQLAAAGLDLGQVAGGTAALTASLVERRDNAGVVTVHADLAQATLRIPQLGWSKPAGADAAADLRVLLDHDRITGLDQLALQGTGLAVRGHATYRAGALASVQFDQLVLGGTQATGEVLVPAAPDAPIRATVSGRALDLSGLFHHAEPRQPRAATAEKPGRPWYASLKFASVILGHDRAGPDASRADGTTSGSDRSLDDVTAQAESDGRVLRRVTVSGRANEPFRITVTPLGSAPLSGRQVTAEAGDAGALLRAFDIVDSMQGGRFTMTGRYDDSRTDHPLTGTAELSAFRLRQAPAATRILKAMTLYGLADVLSGPGIGFSRMIAPFRLTDGVLELTDARAFSASLGFTAKGLVDVDAQTTDVRGTVVPAYFFNTLLGRVPLVGRLFSPETGGGVFAATYAVKGPVDDPAVSVNPLAALTPGFLRGLFGIFGK